MNKIFILTAIVGSIVFGAFSPTEAEALKIKVKPSVTFHSSNRVHHPRPYRRVVRREVYREYDPYTGRVYVYDYPCRDCEVVEYYDYPHYTHFHGTDFNLNFRLR